MRIYETKYWEHLPEDLQEGVYDRCFDRETLDDAFLRILREYLGLIKKPSRIFTSIFNYDRSKK